MATESLVAPVCPRNEGLKQPQTVTPRTNIIGAHQSFLTVKAGGRLSARQQRRDRRNILFYKRFYAALAVVGALVGGLLGLDWIPSTWSLGQLKDSLSLPSGSTLALALVLLSTLAFCVTSGSPYLVFAWNCFIKPFFKTKSAGISSSDHQKRLEAFYEGQAAVYDVTRRRLLRGRSTMLKLASAQLKQVYRCSFANDFKTGFPGVNVNDPASLPSPPLSPSFISLPDKAYAWIDIGGGTGENIQKMNAYYPIRNFARVYCVDITPSLCAIAQERFEKLGWTNVVVLCMDAATFTVPEADGPLEVALVTMSYSLSMMETYYPLIDHLDSILSPTGIIGISDFYVSSKRAADPTSQLSWLMRWFWSIWFDLDNIYLHPSRREYMSHKFKTIKSLSCSNQFVRPFIKIPYYIWLGAKTDSMPALNLDPVTVSLAAPKSQEPEELYHELEPASDSEGEEEDEAEEAALMLAEAEAATQQAAVVGASALSSKLNHVHGQGFRWRESFDPSLIPRFKTYIYAFTWEDPRVDLEFLDLKPSDKMMVITSGGCNVLEYAVKVGPQAIHAVDLNPSQNNMLELKLAGISALEYDEFWKLFGLGHVPNFPSLLDSKLSPFLSPFAYHFWKQNSNFQNLYKTGCSGLAIRVFSFVVKMKGLGETMTRLCHSDTLEEQVEIWETEVRPHFLSTWLIRLLNNDRFLWGALGVPPAQMQMLLEEGSAYEYCVNTIDPVMRNSLLKNDNYFFYMPFMMRYSPDSCPSYLTPAAFALLQAHPERLDAIQIHTDMLVNVLAAKIPDGDLTKVILMDHLDWFSKEDAIAEITAVHQKLAVGGVAYWRSAGKRPWYNTLFAEIGFDVVPCQIREGETTYIDRVNMYASFWSGKKY